jgi:hypothetical protein
MGTIPSEGPLTGATGQQQAQPGVAGAGVPAQRAYQPAPANAANTRPGERGGLAHGLARSPLAGFIPWLLFWVIGGPSTWETGAIAALLAAVLLTALTIEHQPAPAARQAGPPAAHQAAGRLDWRRLKVLDVATIVFFAALVIISLATSRQDMATLDKYSQALSSGALGLIALGSILIGHPFTVDYAKEQAPPEVWHTAAFKKVNLVLTSVWTVVFLVCGGLGLLAANVHTKGLQDWLNWYIPIALIIIAIRLNTWYPNHVRSHARGPATL